VLFDYVILLVFALRLIAKWSFLSRDAPVTRIFFPNAVDLFAVRAMLWVTVVFVVVVSSFVRGYDGQTVDSGRLPGDTEPSSYVLKIEPNLETENATFAGRVDITIAVKTTTTAITLNSKDLVLHEVRVTDEITGRDNKVRSWSYEEDREQVIISMEGHVLANRVYTIRIKFEGILRDDGRGFFKSAYETESDGKK